MIQIQDMESNQPVNIGQDLSIKAQNRLFDNKNI